MRTHLPIVLACLLVPPASPAECSEKPQPPQAAREAQPMEFCEPARPDPDIGIHVDCPKIYDNRTLELMLAAAQRDLAQLRFFDQAGISKQIGALQGGTAQESNFGLQLTGLPTPQTVTTAGTSASQTLGTSSSIAPTGTTTGATSSLTNGSTGGTTVTQNSVTPAVPALSALSGASSLPSTFSNSALSTLNEQLQLTFEIANLRLLLEGSLSDHFRGGSQAAKRRVTIGFPISIEVPAVIAGRDAVAEVQVTVTTDKDALTYSNSYVQALRTFHGQAFGSRTGASEAPGLVAILPRERSYNTAHITDNQKSFAGAAVASVLSLGLSWTGRTKTFYLLQDLDTVALERAADATAPSASTSFAWQFRPVLNQPAVSTGLRQTFVQLAFAVPDAAPRFGTAKVVVRWRKYSPKKRAVGDVLTWRNPKTHVRGAMETTLYQSALLPNFDLTPDPQLVSVTDIGQGRVHVRVLGDFLPDTYVRVGDAILDEPTSTILHDPSGLRFFVSAASMMANGITLVARDGNETPLSNRDPTVNVTRTWWWRSRTTGSR
jgi:hypothetical protein